MIFSKDKPKNCRGCEHKAVCNGRKRNCAYEKRDGEWYRISRLKHFEDRLFKKLRFEHYNEEDLKDILNQITDLEFSEDAITYLATRTNQFRKIVQTLEQLEKQAKTNQFNVITEDILKGRFNERQSIKIMPPAQKMYA